MRENDFKEPLPDRDKKLYFKKKQGNHMAAAIETTATTLEGQALEILAALQNAENDSSRNAQSRNFVTLTINTDAKTATSTVTLPLSLSIGTTGQIELSATPYLT